MDVRELAQLVIDTLEAQKRYFRTRSQVDLISSKQIEARLRKSAEEVINPTLFWGEDAPGDGTGAR